MIYVSLLSVKNQHTEFYMQTQTVSKILKNLLYI